MGMFDEIRCKFPLPVKGANDLLFQTKDTEPQMLDLFEIRADGTLWHQEYDVEDRSDPKAKGFARMCGCMTRVNKRWVRDRKTQTICFYTYQGKNHEGWIEFKAEFVRGRLFGNKIKVVENRKKARKD